MRARRIRFAIQQWDPILLSMLQIEGRAT